LFIGLIRRGGPLLALVLIAVAAVASLFGSAEVQRVCGSVWFIGAAGLCSLGGLAAGVVALRGRRVLAALPHVGLVLGLAGVVLNQVAGHGGYQFLPVGTGARNYCLARNLRQIEELPFSIRLDSIGTRTSRGFRPAPVVFVSGTSDSSGFQAALTYNRTITVAGYRLMLSQVVEPGFLDEYELTIDSSEFALLHNQHVQPRPGLTVWSFGFDTEQGKVGLLVNRTQQWLTVGDSATVEGARLQLTAASFSPAMGAILIANDVRLRSVLFIGFGLVLVGLLVPLFKKETM
jgi:hypothetical protein